jgi:hypothetical protein
MLNIIRSRVKAGELPSGTRELQPGIALPMWRPDKHTRGKLRGWRRLGRVAGLCYTAKSGSGIV